jgi:PAS domain S-box-containing protein
MPPTPRQPPPDDKNPLRLVFETALDAVIVMKFDGTVADWNDRAVETFGWSREEAIGQNMAGLIIPERYREAHFQGLMTYLETHQGNVIRKRIEIVALRKSGEEFPVELSISPIHDARGVSFVGCVRDITARTAIREAVKQRERQFQLLVQGVKDYAIYMVDALGNVSSWNSGAEHIKGYRADEIIGQHFSVFYTEENQRDGGPMRALAQAEGNGRFEEEGWRVRKDGSRFWASVVIEPIHDESGKLLGFAKVTRDVSEKRQAQDIVDAARERLLQSQKMEAIGQLTGGVAHDFNNLLTIVIGNLEIARRNVDAVAGAAATRLQRALDSATQGAQRAATLTQRLLAFSRQQPLDPKPLDLNKFIASEVDFLQRTLGETIQVEAIGGAGVWRVEVDHNQFESVLLNLAVNARDAMPQGGKLTIETSNAFLDQDYCRANPEVSPGQYVLTSVSDNGTGMNKEVLERVFEPFFSTKAVGKGSGLGLSQVYGFIKQSGGHVKIYSEVGEGTTVRIYLPRLFQEADQVQQPEKSSEVIEGHVGETILVVEDDEDVRAYLVDILGDLGYRVFGAHDAVSAFGLLEPSNTHIDLLLTDVVLPGINGRELARRAQSLRPELKVLYMTGYSRNAVVHQGRLDRGVELIQKPITQRDLASRIRDLLDAARNGGSSNNQ